MIALLLASSLVAPVDSLATAPVDSLSDAQFLERLRAADLEDIPPELLEFDTAWRDSLLERHEGLGYEDFARAAGATQRGFRWDLGLGGALAGYSRVEGATAAGSLELAPRGWSGPRLAGQAGWAFGSEQLRYRGELEVPLGQAGLVFAGGYRDQVVPFGSNRVFWNSARALVGGDDQHSWMAVRGGFAQLRFGDQAWLGWRAEHERPVGLAEDYSLFGELERPNPDAVDGTGRALEVGVAVGGSEFDRFGGWLSHEVAGGALGGDFDYQCSTLRLRARQYLGRQELVAELLGVNTGGTVPEQARADIGGLATLRGWEPRSATGRRSLAGRLEWRWPWDPLRASGIPVARSLRLQLVPWADAARVFEGDRDEWLASTGIGVQRFLGFLGRASKLRVDLARPLGPDRQEDWWWSVGFAGAF